MSRVRDPYARFCERDKVRAIFSNFTLLDFVCVILQAIHAQNKTKKIPNSITLLEIFE